MDLTSLVGGAASGLVGGLLQLPLMKMQADQQHAENEWAFRQSMDAQNSAWQRGTRDMELAGLNPMLAYTQGGAGSASALPASMPDFGAAASGVVSNASQGAQTVMAAQRLEGEISSLHASAAAATAKAALDAAEAGNKPAQNAAALASSKASEASANASNAAAESTRVKTLRDKERLAAEHGMGPHYRTLQVLDELSPASRGAEILKSFGERFGSSGDTGETGQPQVELGPPHG